MLYSRNFIGKFMILDSFFNLITARTITIDKPNKEDNVLNKTIEVVTKNYN